MGNRTYCALDCTRSRIQFSVPAWDGSNGVAGARLSVSAGWSFQSLWRVYDRFGDCHPVYQLALFCTYGCSDLLYGAAHVRTARGTLVRMAGGAAALCLVLGDQVGVGDEPGYTPAHMCLLAGHAHGWNRVAGQKSMDSDSARANERLAGVWSAMGIGRSGQSVGMFVAA